MSDQVQQQIGFDVVLLDNKCFPIMENDSTSVIDFWKSNRKVLAASKDLYIKLTGSSADPKHARKEIDLTNIDENAPKRRCCSPDSSKLDNIIEGIECLKKGNEILKVVSNVFECIICKDVMQHPQYAPCCHRVIGCQSCIDIWLNRPIATGTVGPVSTAPLFSWWKRPHCTCMHAVNNVMCCIQLYIIVY